MRSTPVEQFDALVEDYLREYGTTHIGPIARHLDAKWDRVNRSVYRLVAKGKVEEIPVSGGKGYVFRLSSTFANDTIPSAGVSEQPASSKQEMKQESDEYYARPSPVLTRSADPSDIREIGGFVCHINTPLKNVPDTFVLARFEGFYFAEVTHLGRMPAEFCTDDGTNGQWDTRIRLGGNTTYMGFLRNGGEPRGKRLAVSKRKDGSVGPLSIMVVPRYIYGNGCDETAVSEFDAQIREVLDALQGYGWEFGQVYSKGHLSFAHRHPTAEVSA